MYIFVESGDENGIALCLSAVHLTLDYLKTRRIISDISQIVSGLACRLQINTLTMDDIDRLYRLTV
jgi:hypothetical protein